MRQLLKWTASLLLGRTMLLDGTCLSLGLTTDTRTDGKAAPQTSDEAFFDQTIWLLYGRKTQLLYNRKTQLLLYQTAYVFLDRAMRFSIRRRASSVTGRGSLSNGRRAFLRPGDVLSSAAAPSSRLLNLDRTAVDAGRTQQDHPESGREYLNELDAERVDELGAEHVDQPEDEFRRRQRERACGGA